MSRPQKNVRLTATEPLDDAPVGTGYDSDSSVDSDIGAPMRGQHGANKTFLSESTWRLIIVVLGAFMCALLIVATVFAILTWVDVGKIDNDDDDLLLSTAVNLTARSARALLSK